jgi:O-antigen ligase
MKVLKGKPTAALLALGGVIYVVLLAVALIWFHLSPDIVLALTLGGIAVPLFSLRPMVGIHAFLMTLYVENSFGENVLLMKAIGVMILVGWLLNVAIRRTIRLNLTPLIVVALLFVTWCGITTIFAEDSREAILRTFQFVQLAIAALMFSSVLDSTPKIRAVCVDIVVWTCVATLIAIGMYYLGITPIAMGFVHNRNLLALYINIAIVCAYVLYQAIQNPAGKIIVLSTFPIFFLGVALTLSRTGLITLVLTLVILWLRLARDRGVFAIGSTLAVLCAISFMLPDAFWKRADSILPAIERQEDTFGLRVKIWKVGLEMFRDHPITGVGAGNFLSSFSRYAHGHFLWRHLSPHNGFVGVASETGAVGLALFVLILWFAMATARRAIRAGAVAREQQVKYFAVVAEVSVLAQIVGCFSGDGESLKLLWIMFGIALSLDRMGREALERRAIASTTFRREPKPIDAPAWGLVR